MTVLEPGPAMGFFTLELARRVGPKGRVVAVEVQRQMLEGLVKRATKAGLGDRIDARLTKGDRLGVEDYAGKVDFALAFAMVHEVTDRVTLFTDIRNSLAPGGKVLFAEPAGHVRADAFETSLAEARQTGLAVESRPTVRRSRAAVLVRS